MRERGEIAQNHMDAQYYSQKGLLYLKGVKGAQHQLDAIIQLDAIMGCAKKGSKMFIGVSQQAERERCC